jgi:hypothetical protein
MPTIVSNNEVKKVPNIKPLNVGPLNKTEFSNIVFPFGKIFGPKIFGELTQKLSVYSPNNNGIKIPVPGEGLPRIINYCADQSGCAFWRMIWPGDELLANNKAVVMTLYQMVTLGQFYGGIDAVRLQRQCTEPQLEFIKFLRNVSDQMKQQTGKGFRIIYEIDDICCPASYIPDYNVCKTAFEGDQVHKNMKEIMHYCIDKDANVICSINGSVMNITIEELEEHFLDKKDILILSKDIDNDVIQFKPLENVWVTNENAEVLEIIDEDTKKILRCTPDHPVYTKNRGWVIAKDLQENDILDII